MKKHLFEYPKKGGWQDEGPGGRNEHCEICGQHISHKNHYRRIPKSLLSSADADADASNAPASADDTATVSDTVKP